MKIVSRKRGFGGIEMLSWLCYFKYHPMGTHCFWTWQTRGKPWL